MNIVCLDMEGVLVPEIWIAFSEASGIPELRRTTRDEPDYDKLMRYRLDILNQHGYGLKEIQETIARMEEEGIICGYPTLINWDCTDNEMVTALIEVNVALHRETGFDKVAERIYQFDEVESVYLMSGSFDLTVILEGKSMKEVARFVTTKLSPIEEVVNTSTFFVLKKYKEHGLLMVREKNEQERMLITP